MSFDVAKASVEVHRMTMEQFHAEAAYAWGSRAVVSWRQYVDYRDVNWLVKYQSFRDEAVEHAALAGLDLPQFLSEMSNS
jgi:hypothetical protein